MPVGLFLVTVVTAVIRRMPQPILVRTVGSLPSLNAMIRIVHARILKVVRGLWERNCDLLVSCRYTYRVPMW